MKTIEIIREQLSKGNYELSGHALIRAVERQIYYFEIEEVGENAEIIEEYHDDKYSPSCLVVGFSKKGKPLHIQVSRADTEYLKIITVYVPDEDNFINFRTRR